MLPESQGKVMEFGSVMGKFGKIISENINKLYVASMKFLKNKLHIEKKVSIINEYCRKE